ncbi:head GIN domain-containing protein [Sphingomicrobium aestuariivivum]|uniref:head GIN domain-containing protein n=1 Tax=Sphingomicrobium aestuariivivum TaxID=1582356 RepID=UPI001FD6763F|nr:head GIN domain-containing protein [Sphingomicrobium aestuariivivum]MCJ8190967.1 DUF2807 domain-containing protein [Sphingomicrobium aestuariivivum]
MFVKASTIALLTGAISSCADFVSEDRIEIETGPAVTRTIEAQDFDRLAVSGRYDVIVVPGEAVAVEMVGPENVIDQTEFSFADGLLTIRPEERGSVIFRWADDKVPTIRITSPGISEATILGSADVRLEAVDAEAFTGNIKGSGDLRLDAVNTKTLAFDVRGSGDISAAGTTERLDIAIAGSGDISTRELIAANADISIAGSGDVNSRVTGEADVRVAGSGDVVVSGGATCNISKAGSGDVSCTS